MFVYQASVVKLVKRFFKLQFSQEAIIVLHTSVYIVGKGKRGFGFDISSELEHKSQDCGGFLFPGPHSVREGCEWMQVLSSSDWMGSFFHVLLQVTIVTINNLIGSNSPSHNGYNQQFEGYFSSQKVRSKVTKLDLKSQCLQM